MKKTISGWRKDLFWNGYIRLALEGCLELFIVVVLNYRINMNVIYSNGKMFYKWDSGFEVVNNVMLVFLSLISISMLFFIVVFYLRNYH